MIHWGVGHGRMACGVLFNKPEIDVHFGRSERQVTCRSCLEIKSKTSESAAARLAELDRAQGQSAVEEFRAVNNRITEILRKSNFDTFEYTYTPPVHLPSVQISGIVLGDNQRVVDQPLLTRISDFITSLPGGSLDRARNVEAMNLRRAIATILCPPNAADKGKK